MYAMQRSEESTMMMMIYDEYSFREDTSYLGTIRYCSLLFFFERIVTFQFFQSAIIITKPTARPRDCEILLLLLLLLLYRSVRKRRGVHLVVAGWRKIFGTVLPLLSSLLERCCYSMMILRR